MKKAVQFFIFLSALLLLAFGPNPDAGAQSKRPVRISRDAAQVVSKDPDPAIRRRLAESAFRGNENGSADAGNTDPCTISTPIAVGATLNGSLGSGDCQLQNGTYIDFYSFSGTAGQPVIISMDSTFDTYLYLYDASRTIIEENDDSGTGTNSRIPMSEGVFILPVTGQYYIGANSLGPASGSYSVTLATDPACAAAVLPFEQWVNGTLANTDCKLGAAGDIYYMDLYSFSGTAGDQVNLTMNSTAVDAYLVLHTPSGTGTIENDDGGGGNNARIPPGLANLTLPETGTYTIEASSFDPSEVGAYNLKIAPPDIVAPDTQITSGPVNPAGTGAAVFTFTGDDGTGSGIASYECKLDGAAFAACTSPVNFAGLAEGAHSFQVRATDFIGNTDASPATYNWNVDVTPPDSSITANPPSTTPNSFASFSFSGNDGAGSGVASFECRIDLGIFFTCTSPINLNGLLDGPHTFQVRAVDGAGTPDPTPASYNWTIDSVAPNTSITANPTSPSNSTSAAFSFAGNDGAGTGIASFECRVDTAPFAACTSPVNFTNLTDGQHTFEVRAIDNAGNTDATAAGFTWTVDSVAPDTSITASPATQTNNSSAAFSFSGNDGGGTGIASFECKLDAAAFAACTSPVNLNGLTDGSHTFQVRAKDNAGNTDASPANFTWTVDTAAPDTSITANPASASNNTSAAFSFTGNDGSGTGVAGFECRLDAAPFAACTSPVNLNGLTEGSHTFQVRAVDSVGNADATAASFTWTVDLTAPDTSITASPASQTNSSSAAFTFSGNDGSGSGVASFECKLDAAAFAACTSPVNLNGLGDGSHTFQVRAKDNAGNTDATPASFTWTVDTAAPDTSITSNPPVVSNSAAAAFSFTGNDGSGTGVASFECRLDAAPFAACTSPVNLNGLSEGSHTFQVRAVDSVGNADATAASFTWTVDTAAPDTSINGNPGNPTTSTSATFSFTGNDGAGSGIASFECKLDTGGWNPCASGVTFTQLALGAHTFEVRATDNAGNTDATPAVFNWTISAAARGPFDFDGDGKTDISIFRPAPAEWWYLKSSNGGNAAAQFGQTTDKLVPADYTGDGKADFAFFRPSTGFWYILRSEDFSFYAFPFGSGTDVPMPADYDGDGRADPAVFRESTGTWFIQRSTDGGVTIQGFGIPGDLPVAADYDGDGKADLAVWRPNGASGAEWWIQRSAAGLFATVFGVPGDDTVPGDYTGDGKADIAFYRPSTGEWFILRSENLTYYAFGFGASGDAAAPGDYDGDGRFDAAVYRGSATTWFLNRSTAGIQITTFGAPGDVPVPGAYVR